MLIPPQNRNRPKGEEELAVPHRPDSSRDEGGGVEVQRKGMGGGPPSLLGIMATWLSTVRHGRLGEGRLILAVTSRHRDRL